MATKTVMFRSGRLTLQRVAVARCRCSGLPRKSGQSGTVGDVLSHMGQYKKGKNTTQTAKKVYDVYERSAVLVRVAQNWCKNFQFGNFDVKDQPRSGRPVTNKVDAILEKIEQDQHISSYHIAEELFLPPAKQSIRISANG
ncbi:hypothetical protein EVAR_5421_1 [Eumeta japonica]|uniref:Uncharacterized protein n=1 Tax=Eumeta variegata TaxID=151549 RepID=A0A4C1TBK4_EUMVA|nr:hypothetical protein EVAR_5421_1 [Eumeta japonica]